METKEDPTTYDQIPYTISSYPLTHPCHIATVARMFGVDSVDPSNARILEIGCGHGGNILPMAEQLPQSSFVAIDLSETQINNAKTLAEAAKLENIELLKKDLSTIDQSFGEFDYIIAHGVYSWVSSSVQENLLRICRENLSPKGISFVSYNTYPGWRIKESIRDMLQIHTERFDNPLEVLQNAQGLLGFLRDAASRQDTIYSKFIKSELDRLIDADPRFFYHDILEENNIPIYFKEFFQRVVDVGLKYIGDSSTWTMLTRDLDHETRNALEKATSDIVTHEQYLDFLRNRTFRQSLICHKDVNVDRNVKPDSIKSFLFRSNFKAIDSVDLRDGHEVMFATQSGVKISVKQSLEKTVLHELEKANPKFLGYDDIVNRSRHALNGVVSEERFNELESALFVSLFNLLNTNGLVASVYTPEIVDYISDYPKVSPLARAQAGLNISLTNRYHENCTFGKLQNQILTLLDGENSVEDITDRLIKNTGSDALKVEKSGETISDPTQLRDIYIASVNRLLNTLAANALLIA